MPKHPKHDVRLTGPARRDISDVMEWTVQQFGARTALRYDTLIKQALKDIANNPDREGARTRPDLMVEGAHIYHLEFSRNRVSGLGVKHPRHFLLYRVLKDGMIEVARILHDARDLARHLPDHDRRTDTDG